MPPRSGRETSAVCAHIAVHQTIRPYPVLCGVLFPPHTRHGAGPMGMAMPVCRHNTGIKL
eukprot:1311548-Prymnesium_polylepis.1